VQRTEIGVIQFGIDRDQPRFQTDGKRLRDIPGQRSLRPFTDKVLPFSLTSTPAGMGIGFFLLSTSPLVSFHTTPVGCNHLLCQRLTRLYTATRRRRYADALHVGHQAREVLTMAKPVPLLIGRKASALT